MTYRFNKTAVKYQALLFHLHKAYRFETVGTHYWQLSLFHYRVKYRFSTLILEEQYALFGAATISYQIKVIGILAKCEIGPSL